jgi:hypothetical protein
MSSDFIDIPNGYSMPLRPKTHNLNVLEHLYDSRFYEAMATIMTLRQTYIPDFLQSPRPFRFNAQARLTPRYFQPTELI